jgi:membrane-associated phospholipid phosphatase
LDAAILEWIHGYSHPALDGACTVSWALGVLRFCAPAILLVMAWHLSRGERREALAWLAVGASAAILPELVKAVVARARPTLWPWLIPTSGFSFPSGHAVAGAALYPLLGFLVLRRRGLGLLGYLLGLAVGVFIGLGRLYAGVHWPSDVLAGWTMGAALSLGAIRWLGGSLSPSALTAPAGSSRVDDLGSR